MPNEKQVYSGEAGRYEALVSREDYQGNIPRALDGIVRVDGLDVIDLGAGTGRLSAMAAPRARSVRAFDLSYHMLKIAQARLVRFRPQAGSVVVADHRFLPAPAASADVILSGWSVSYLAVWNPGSWRAELDGWLREARRVLRPQGHIVLFESLGTGNETPKRLEHLEHVYNWLDENSFKNRWIRTDYWFASLEEAAELAGFFFGDELAEKIRKERLMILPECTGVYWLDIRESRSGE